MSGDDGRRALLAELHAARFLARATAESGRRYSELHLGAAQDLAERCAIALENAQLLSGRPAQGRVLTRSSPTSCAILLPPAKTPSSSCA